MLHQVNIHLVIIHFVSLFFFYFGAVNCSRRCRRSSQAAGSKSESTNLKKILDEKQKQAVVLTQSSVSLQSVQKQDPASAAAQTQTGSPQDRMQRSQLSFHSFPTYLFPEVVSTLAPCPTISAGVLQSAVSQESKQVGVGRGFSGPQTTFDFLPILKIQVHGEMMLWMFSWSRSGVVTSAVKRSIGFTIGFHNHGEGPY